MLELESRGELKEGSKAVRRAKDDPHRSHFFTEASETESRVCACNDRTKALIRHRPVSKVRVQASAEAGTPIVQE